MTRSNLDILPRSQRAHVSAEGVQIASPEDLLATKLKALFDRVEWKDYRDISVLLENKVDLARGLSIARKMFGQEFQLSECLKALTYFKGGDLYLLSEQDRLRLVSAAASVRSLPQVDLASADLSADSVSRRQPPI